MCQLSCPFRGTKSRWGPSRATAAAVPPASTTGTASRQQAGIFVSIIHFFTLFSCRPGGASTSPGASGAQGGHGSRFLGQPAVQGGLPLSLVGAGEAAHGPVSGPGLSRQVQIPGGQGSGGRAGEHQLSVAAPAVSPPGRSSRRRGRSPGKGSAAPPDGGPRSCRCLPSWSR